MPTFDGHTLLTLLIVACSSGVFLRLVAKEKRRREKYLGLRLTEKMKELEAEERRKKEEAEERRRKEAREASTTGEEPDAGEDEESGSQ